MRKQQLYRTARVNERAKYPSAVLFQRLLETELKSKLDIAGAARSENRIAVDDVGCAASAAERSGVRGVVADGRVHHAAVRIGQIDVIEDVKHLEAEFGDHPLLEP